MHALHIALRTVYSIFLALDLLGSALTGGAPLQTLSARAAVYRGKGSEWGTTFADGIDWAALTLFRQPNHCQGALVAYLARLEVAPSLSG